MSTSDHAGLVGGVGRRNDDVIERFDAHEAALGRTGEQVRQRRRLLYRLADVCAPRSLLEATKQDVLEVLAKLSQRPKTRNYYLSRYAGFYRWAIAEELCEADPTMKIQRAPQPRPAPRPVSEEQLGETPIEEPMALELALGLGLDDDMLQDLAAIALFEAEINTAEERLEDARQHRTVARAFAEGTINEKLLGPLTREERADRARRSTWVAELLEDDELRGRLRRELPAALVDEYRIMVSEVLDARRRPYPLDVELIESPWSCVNCGAGVEAGAAEALIVHDRTEETSQPIRYCAACVSLAAAALER